MERAINLVGQDVRRSLSPRLLLTILLIAFSVLLDNLDAVRFVGDSSGPSVYYFLFFSISFGGLFGRYFLAMLCALPFATGFLTEYDNYFLPYAVVRSNKRAYLASKFAIGSLSGGVAAALGLALLIATLSIWCPPIVVEEFDPTWYYMRSVTLSNGMPYYLYSVYYAFLIGCLWAGIAVCISAYIRSIYFTVAAPFVASFMLSHSLKLLRIPNEYRIDMWLNMRTIINSEGVTMGVSAIFVVVILALLGLLFMRKGKRLIENA